MKRLLKITLLLLPTGQQFFYWWHKNQVKHTRIVEKDHPSNNPDNYFEQLFTEQPDPWKYTNNYEKLKYDQTLAMLPHQVINTALELACAEGFFTAKLATKVRYLISTDISSTAISRCQAKMADLTNVEFRCLDFVNETIPGTFDLIVCSEVLYFVGNRSNLPPVVDKFVKALNPGGYLLMAHANVTIDDPLGSGFTWNHALGAKFIGETFAKSSQLKFLQELQTPLYRIQLFQKLAKPRVWQLSNKPIKQEFIKELVIDDINPEVLQDIVMSPITQLPIICYEDIRLENESNSPNIITPQILATHLAYLKENGFQSITFGKWASQVINQVAMSKPKIILIFKNNSVNFANYAWPLLQEYGFTCNLGLYADEIGKLLTTDPNTREQIDLIPWKEIRELQGQGLNFVSRGFSRHPEGQNLFNFKRSYKILQEELATPIYTYLYPTGKSNIFWQYLAGISGYEYGITEKSGLCTMNDSLLALPSLNIQHNTNLQEELNHV